MGYVYILSTDFYVSNSLKIYHRFLSWLGNCSHYVQNHTMKSRIFKAIIAIIAPIAIEYIVKKISEKLDKKEDQKEKEPKQITA